MYLYSHTHTHMHMHTGKHNIMHACSEFNHVSLSNNGRQFQLGAAPQFDDWQYVFVCFHINTHIYIHAHWYARMFSNRPRPLRFSYLTSFFQAI